MTRYDAPRAVSDADVQDLRRRLQSTRRVRLPKVVPWSRGTDADYLVGLIEYWATEYDWRTHEAEVQALPWVRTPSGSAVHQSAGDGCPTVLLLHGWPDSVLRYQKVLPMLTDVNVVVPALPGFPFAPALLETGNSTTFMADNAAALMADLGYDRYTVSGGDFGASIGDQLAYRHKENVVSLHLTDLPFERILDLDPTQLSDDERVCQQQLNAWLEAEGAYQHEHATRPHTLAVAVGDSPAGLLSWIVEKLRGWSDSGGDVESVFPRDDLLTWVTAYWFTNTIGTSFGPYFEAPEPAGRIEVPTFVSQFPADAIIAPRALGERFYDIRAWNDETSGGHFPAWETPRVFVTRLREALIRDAPIA